MSRIQTLQSRVRPAQSRIKPQTTKDRRTKGRALQSIRFQMWKQDQHCASCGDMTAHPYGYEIDHIIPLEHGGEDGPFNRQLLCVDCHKRKTIAEAKQR